MKKIPAAILLLILTISLISCGEREPSVEEYEDHYLYTMIDNILHRINVETATAVPLCPDPLCAHNGYDCPYYRINENTLQTVGKYTYCTNHFKMENFSADSTNQLCRIDLTNGKVEVLYAPDGEIKDVLATENEVYFVLSTSEFIQNGNTGTLKNKYDICHYDLKTKKVKTLTDEPLSYQSNLYGIKDGRLYYSGFNQYLSLDLKTLDVQEADVSIIKAMSGLHTGNYRFDLGEIVEILYKGNNCPVYELCREDLKTGERIKVLDAVPVMPFIYGDKIVYRKTKEPTLIGYNDYIDAVTETVGWTADYDCFDGNLYVCDLDGQNERILLDVGSMGFFFPPLMYYLGEKDKIGIDNVIAIEVWRYVYEEGTQNIETNTSHILLIDVTTGETREVQVETRS